MESRIWNRGASQNRRNNSAARNLPELQVSGDTLQSTVLKSNIASTILGARQDMGKASLMEPSRPFTPGNLGRHLFSGDDYSNRPGSSYKIKSIIGQASEDFNRDINSTMTTNYSANTGQKSAGGVRVGSQNKDQNVLNLI